MRIILVNAPYLRRFSRPQRSPGVIKSGTLYYPYWLSFCAGVLDEAGHEVHLLDAVAEGMDWERSLNRLATFGAGLAVVETSTPSIANDLAFAARLKERGAAEAVVLVGTHASALAADIVRDNRHVDFVAAGEYEHTVRDLAACLEAGADPSGVPGIVLMKDGVPHAGPDREPIENLDVLPFISRVYKRFLPIERYAFSLARHPMVMLVTGRGCPNNCFFCVYSQTLHGRRYRFRSPENVVEELAWIAAHMPDVKEVVFEDDTFTANEPRVRELCRLMLERRIGLPWFCNIRVNTSRETLEIMRRAGLRRCAVGFESGDQAILDAMRKGTTLEQAYAFKAECDRLGILVHGCFMVGFPGETRASMERTVAFAKKLRCDSAQFYPIFPYPGTEAYAWLESRNYLRTTDYARWLDDSGGHNCVFDLPGLPAEELMAFTEKAYRDYYTSPGYLARKALQSVLRPEEAMRNLKGGVSLFGNMARRTLRWLAGR